MTALIFVVVGLVAFVLVSEFVLPEKYNVFRDLFPKEQVTEAVSVQEGEFKVPDFRTKSYTEVIVSDYN